MFPACSVRRLKKLLASSTLIDLLSILDQHGIPYRYRKSDNQIRLLEPDATILLRSLDNPNASAL